MQETFGVTVILTMFYLNEEQKFVENLSEIKTALRRRVEGVGGGWGVLEGATISDILYIFL